MNKENKQDPVEDKKAYEKKDITIDIGKLPEQFRIYVEALMKETCCDVVSATINTLSMASAILQKTLYIPKHGTNGIDGGYFQTLYPNLWILEVNKSGNFKTTVQNNAHEIVYEIDEKIKNAIIVFEKLANSSVEGNISSIHGIESLPINVDDFLEYIETKSNNKREDKLKDSIKEKLSKVKRKEYSISKHLVGKNFFIPTKITLEALLQYISLYGGGLILSSEFTNWLSFVSGGIKSKNARATLTDLYDVPRKYVYATKTEGFMNINEPFISICGAMTYNSFKTMVSKEDILSGFLARFLLFTPNQENIKYHALPQKNTGRAIFEAKNLMIEYLLQCPEKICYDLSGDAITYFESYHKNLFKFTNEFSQNHSELIDPFLKRWSPYFLKISMIMQFFEDKNTSSISKESIERSKDIINCALESTKLLIYEYITKPNEEDNCDTVLQYLTDHNGQCKWKELISSHKLSNGSNEYKKTLSILEKNGRIELIQAAKKQDLIIKLK